MIKSFTDWQDVEYFLWTNIDYDQIATIRYVNQKWQVQIEETSSPKRGEETSLPEVR